MTSTTTTLTYPQASTKRGEAHITMNWRGRPLTSLRPIIELISDTATSTGLTIQAGYDPNWYPTGVKISDAELAAVPLAPHDFHGDWNYTITAQPNPT